MHSRILTAAGVGVLAVAVATTLALPASASNHSIGTAAKATGHSKSAPVAKPAKTKTCYDQITSPPYDDNGVGIVSQNFEASFDIYDSQGADDFTLTKKCKVTDVHVRGLYFNGAGPCRSLTVTIYKDNGNSAPGAVIYGPADQKFTTSAGNPNVGDTQFDINKLSPAAPLGPGTYWISVYCNMDFSVGGEWGWMTNNTVNGDASMWQNPGGGFGVGCTSYTTTTSCIPSGEGGDFAFSLTTKKKHHK
jgi:hypothetical protein